MATTSWSSATLHNTDADFRAWGSELSNKLQTVGGLTKTSDTGQINWTTVTKPTTSTDAGYEVYYLNDSLHATAPIYFKIGYGTGGNSTTARLRLQQVGTATNGAGTLSGIGSDVGQTFANKASNSAAEPSYLCATTGFVGLAWKDSAYFSISRTCDADGTMNGKGALLVLRNATSGTTVPTRALRFESTAAAYPSASFDTNHGISTPYQNITGTDQNGDQFAWLAWGAFPDVRPIPSLCVVVSAAISDGASFVTKTVGTANRTFLKVSTLAYNYPIAVNTSTWALAMLWE